MPPSPRIHATALMTRFRCVGPACEDSCCSGWDIEVDAATLRKYKRDATLSRAVQPDAEKGTGCIMCRDDASGDCGQLAGDGLCRIQARHGEDYLSEVCHFFPRSFRLLGGEQLASVLLSCPETARMALYGQDMFARTVITLPRTIPDLSQRLPAGLPFETALRIHRRILDSLDDDSLPVEAHFARQVALAYGLDGLAKPDWEGAADFYLHRPAPPAPPAENAEVFALAHAALTIAATDTSQYRPRLYRTIRDMETALELAFHWTQGSMETGPGSAAAWQAALATWHGHAAAEDAMLKNWLRAQLARIVFPFGGLGESAARQISALVLAFATTRLALICAHHLHANGAEPVDTVRIVQSLARLFEHIDDISAFDDHYPTIDRHRQEALQRLLVLPFPASG